MLGWVGETLGKVGFPPFSLSLDGRVWWVGKGELQLRLLVPGKKYPETGVILESEFCMVQNPCLSKSHKKFGLQDHPCFRILLAWDKYCYL